MFLKTETLNAVLHHLLVSKDSSISAYFYAKGIRDEKVISSCRAELKKGGYIIYFTIADYGIKETITDTGVSFINKGGFSGKMNEAIENERRSKNIMNSALNLLSESKNISTSLIINNKVKIEYALLELSHIDDLLESNKTFLPAQLRSYISNIKTIVDGVFLPSHKIHQNFVDLYPIKEEIYQLTNNAIHYLEFELIDLKTDLSRLHLSIKDKVEKLINEGNNDSAVFSAFKTLEIEVKNKSGVNETGMTLMNKVFSSNNPIIKLSDDKNEQEGFMYLFKGAMGAIRNREGHNNVKYSTEETIELVSFASYLIRLLDSQK